MPVTLKPRDQSVARLDAAATLLRILANRLQFPGPLVCLDLEGTGPFRDYDRICEIGAVKVKDDGTHTLLSTLVNPGIPISKGASEKTGIGDADVQGAPLFVELAPALARGLAGVVLVGYNLRTYDIPVLNREFSIAGLSVDLSLLPVIDGFSIYQQKHPRDLDAAVKEFCQRDRAESHDAGVDVFDTIDVVIQQLARYDDLPREVAALATYCDRKKPDYIDRAGKFQFRDGVPIVAFSKNAGTPMHLVDPGFYHWILRGDFDADTKDIALAAANGSFPTLEKPNDDEETNEGPPEAQSGLLAP